MTHAMRCVERVPAGDAHGAGGLARAASIEQPRSIDVDFDANLYVTSPTDFLVSDARTHSVRKVINATSVIERVAGA